MCRRALGFQGSAEKELLLQETDLAPQRVQFQKLAFFSRVPATPREGHRPK